MKARTNEGQLRMHNKKGRHRRLRISPAAQLLRKLLQALRAATIELVRSQSA
jgi:hypothetical protein